MENRYDAQSFNALGELESIRVNAPMYLGSRGLSGIQKLLVEVMDNSKDEANPLKGVRKVVMEVELYPDGSARIRDNARGIPVDINEKTGLPAIYLAFEIKHAGAKLRNQQQEFYSGSTGVHGIGLSAVNACSKFLDIRVRREGKIYEVKYKNGGSEREDLKIIGECDIDDTGTEIHFLYDNEVLQAIDDNRGEMDYPFEISEIQKIIEDYVTFNDNFEVNLIWDTGEIGEDDDSEYSFRGLRGEQYYSKDEYSVENIFKQYDGGYEVIEFEEENEEENYKVRILFNFVSSYSETIKLSVVNGMRMKFGSRHQKAIEDEVYKYFNSMMRVGKKLKEGYDLTWNEVINKFNYIILLVTDHRDFENQAKASYSNDAIAKALRESFREVLNGLNSDVVGRMIENIEYEYKEKIEQVKKYQKEMENKLPRKNKRDTQEALQKFKDCRNGKEKRKQNRVWILEGNSAANAFAYNRDPNREAYAPLKGKPLNVIKNSIKRKRIDSKGKREVVDYTYFTMIRTIVEMNKFDSYIICTDADIDGLHIRNLVSYMFYKYFPQTILKGQLYIAEAPLYKFTKGKDVVYAYNEEERDELVRKGYSFRRYKGLGEMEKGELYNVMSESNRFIQLTLDDIERPLSLYSNRDWEGDLELEERILSSGEVIEHLAGRDTAVRKTLAREFMNEDLKEILDKENKIRNSIVSRINPMYLDDDGIPMTQEEIDEITIMMEKELIGY